MNIRHNLTMYREDFAGTVRWHRLPCPSSFHGAEKLYPSLRIPARIRISFLFDRSLAEACLTHLPEALRAKEICNGRLIHSRRVAQSREIFAIYMAGVAVAPLPKAGSAQPIVQHLSATPTRRIFEKKSAKKQNFIALSLRRRASNHRGSVVAFCP